MRTDASVNYIAEKNKQSNKPVFLYTVCNYDGNGADLHFAEYDTDVELDGITYTKFPIAHEYIGENSQGQIDEVHITIANVTRMIEAYLQMYNGLRDRKVHIMHGWIDQLDMDDFIKETYWIDYAESDEDTVKFVLNSRYNILNIELPGRRYNRTDFPGIPTRRVYVA